MHHSRITHVLLDIDDTLTCYAPHALDRTFDGNFLFPLLLDLAETRKIPRREAETIIRRTTQENPFWDYTDFLSPLSLSFSDVLPHFRSWHAKNLIPFPDSVQLTRSLKRAGYGISIISNNPRLGCLLKLERCGLANAATGESCFSQILSTDRIAGCKGDPGVWNHALEKLDVPPGQVITVGDNLREDAQLPLQQGVAYAFLLLRPPAPLPQDLPPRLHTIRNAMQIMDFLNTFSPSLISARA